MTWRATRRAGGPRTSPTARDPRTAATAVVVALASTAVLAACGGASAASGPTGTGLKTAYLLQVQTTVVVDTQGYAVYLFVPDHRRRVSCVATCAIEWPTVPAPEGSRPSAGTGINPSLVGSIPGPGGTRVVTYDHWPLYTYADDTQPGIASGQGDDGVWYLLQPDGAALVPPGDPQPT